MLTPTRSEAAITSISATETGSKKASRRRAPETEAVSSRIESIEEVSADLFKEWEAELDQYSNPDLRRSSERQLEQTQDRYGDLITAMKKAESKMEPVLASFRDHVLFLKHNLNAQAIASLQGEVATIEQDTAALIREMEAAIAEADAFIRQMQQDNPA